MKYRTAVNAPNLDSEHSMPTKRAESKMRKTHSIPIWEECRVQAGAARRALQKVNTQIDFRTELVALLAEDSN